MSCSLAISTTPHLVNHFFLLFFFLLEKRYGHRQCLFRHRLVLYNVLSLSAGPQHLPPPVGAVYDRAAWFRKELQTRSLLGFLQAVSLVKSFLKGTLDNRYLDRRYRPINCIYIILSRYSLSRHLLHPLVPLVDAYNLLRKQPPEKISALDWNNGSTVAY